MIPERDSTVVTRFLFGMSEATLHTKSESVADGWMGKTNSQHRTPFKVGRKVDSDMPGAEIALPIVSRKRFHTT